MSKKLSIKDIKSPDKFFKLMLQFVGYLRHNVKLYLTLSGVVVAITAMITITNYFQDSRQEKARREYYRVTKEITKLGGNDISAAIKLIEGVLDKLGNTNAGIEANYTLGELYYGKKEWSTAIKYYDHVYKKGTGLMKTLAMLGLAYSKENNADINGALEMFKKLQDSKPSVYAAAVTLGVARCYQKLGNKGQALANYESLIVTYPDTDYAKQASAAKASL